MDPINLDAALQQLCGSDPGPGIASQLKPVSGRPGQLQGRSTDGLHIYDVSKLSDLLEMADKGEHEDFGLFEDCFSIRYVVIPSEAGLKFVFGAEGTPRATNKIPRHKDLSQSPLMAGNMFFKRQEGQFTLYGVSNKSGDFEPNQSRLYWPLCLLAQLKEVGELAGKNGFILDETLHVAWNLDRSSLSVRTNSFLTGYFKITATAKAVAASSGAKRRRGRGSSEKKQQEQKRVKLAVSRTLFGSSKEGAEALSSKPPGGSSSEKVRFA